jgi:opacity protein-like surface antigen
MKNIVRVLVGVCVGCVAVSSAPAAEPGPYVKAEIGPTFTDDVELKEFVGFGGGGAKIEFDPGMRFAIGGGYAFADWIAIGGETGVSFNYIDNISGNFRGVGDSSVGQVPLLANIIFRIPTKIGLVPFAGAGAGLSFPYFYADDIVFDPDPGVSGDETVVDGSESDTVFAWQVFAGLKYQLDNRMSVGLSYKYLRTESPDWEAEDVFTGFDTEIAIGDLETHAVMFIFSYKF